MISGVLGLLGAGLPTDLMRGDANNERGYFESYGVMEVNDRILNSVGATWKDWRPQQSAWYGTATAKKWRSEVEAVVQAQFSDSPLIVIKDPRICRVTPLWVDALSNLGYRTKGVLIFRNPMEVAASLSKRDGFSQNQGLLIWLRYTLDAEYFSRSLKRSITSFEDIVVNWRKSMTALGADLDVVWPRWSDLAAHEIDVFVSKQLRHHEADEDFPEGSQSVRALAGATYRALKELAAEPHSNSALMELDRVRSQLDQYSEFFGPLVLELELQSGRAQADAATAVERAAALQASAEALYQEISGLKAQVHDLSQALDQKTADHDLARADLDSARGRGRDA